jgi:integrase
VVVRLCDWCGRQRSGGPKLTLVANGDPKDVVELNGVPVSDMNKGFVAAVEAAGLGPEVTPRVLRHTCVTWLMQTGHTCGMLQASWP